MDVNDFNKAILNKLLSEYDDPKNENYADARAAERLVEAYFKKDGKPTPNDNYKRVVEKVVLLNYLFLTNLQMEKAGSAFKIMASTINNLAIHEKLDDKLRGGDVELVGEILNKYDKLGGGRTHYSFVTKFCHMHNDEAYPIYDSRVSEVIYHVAKADPTIKKRIWDDLKDYIKYVETYKEVTHYIGLKGRDLDKAIWMYSKKKDKEEEE